MSDITNESNLTSEVTPKKSPIVVNIHITQSGHNVTPTIQKKMAVEKMRRDDKAMRILKDGEQEIEAILMDGRPEMMMKTSCGCACGETSCAGGGGG